MRRNLWRWMPPKNLAAMALPYWQISQNVQVAYNHESWFTRIAAGYCYRLTNICLYRSQLLERHPINRCVDLSPPRAAILDAYSMAEVWSAQHVYQKTLSNNFNRLRLILVIAFISICVFIVLSVDFHQLPSSHRPIDGIKLPLGVGRHGAVSSESQLCSGVGLQILRAGGNAADAVSLSALLFLRLWLMLL